MVHFACNVATGVSSSEKTRRLMSATFCLASPFNLASEIQGNTASANSKPVMPVWYPPSVAAVIT